jgi:hypothetical protein
MDDTRTKDSFLILDWLHTGPFEIRHASLRDTRMEGSGEWFLKSPFVAKWLAGEGPNSLLCIGLRNSIL